MRWLRNLSFMTVIAFLAVACSSGDVEDSDSDPPQVVYPDSISLQALVGESAQATLTIGNDGEEELNAELLFDETAEWLTVTPTEIDVPGRDSLDVTVSATCPDEAGEHSTPINIYSNDPDRGEASVDVDLSCDALDPASLTVTIEGLPTTVDAAVTVGGPAGFEQSLTATETLDELVPGDYVVEGFETGDEATYAPDVDTVDLTLEPGDHGDVIVTYEVITGELAIAFEGLPQGVDGQATIDGPDEFSATIEGNDTLSELVPGDYDITPADVEHDGALYSASPETIDVASGAESSTTIMYEAITGHLDVEVTGLPEGLDHQIDLVAPDNSTTELPQDGQLTDLTPGDYTLMPHEIIDGQFTYLASEVDVIIISDETAEATIEYLLDPGQLMVTVEGLPTGVDHDIELVASDGTRTDLPQSGEMAAVEPGNYTLDAHEVIDGLATYDVNDVDVEIESGIETTATITYELVPAQWEVTIDGLPDGVDADVDLEGGELDTTIAETTAFNDLVPDTYQVSAHDIIVAPATYTASSGSADLESGANDSFEVNYELVLGSLQINASGIPTGFELQADIMGPGGYSNTITGSQTIDDLEPGDYTVTFWAFEDDGIDYEPTPESVVVEVVSDDTAVAATEFNSVPGDLSVTSTGLPSGLSLQADIEGPNYTNTASGSNTFVGIPAGDYTVTFEAREQDGSRYEPTPQTVEVRVTSGDDIQALTEYSGVPGDLSVAIQFPDDYAFDLKVLDDSDTVVDTQPVSGGDTILFEDLHPSVHSLSAASPLTDEWDNPYVDLDGFDEPIKIDSDDTAITSLSGTKPTLVRQNGDDGDGSLREVLARINADSVITFAENIDEITLTSGDIDIDIPLSIIGDETQRTRIWADGEHRIFTIGADAEVTLQSLQLGGGDASVGTGSTEPDDNGGAIYTDSDLTLFDVELHENFADYRGGAVFSSASITATDITAHNNLADNGAVFYAETIEVDSGYFYDNSADTNGGALLIRIEVIINDSVFHNNSAGSRGGAIHAFFSSTTPEVSSIERTLFLQNSAGLEGGAIYIGHDLTIANSTFHQNSADTSGGGIYNFWNTTTATHSTFTDNEAPDAPAIFNYGDDITDVVLSRTLIANNGDDDQNEIGYQLSSPDPTLSEGYNFVGRTDDEFVDDQPTDIIGTVADPEQADIKYFGFNGGHPQTVSLLDSSPAYQAIPEADCELEVDQRGFARPVNGQCTIGAWEADPNLLDFDDTPLGGSYQSGSFSAAGITWQYESVKDEGSYGIDHGGAMVRDPGAGFWADDIPDGVDQVSIQYRKAWTNANARQFDVLINGVVVESSPVFGDTSDADDTVHTLVVDDLDISGDFSLEIRRSDSPSANAQITFDNLRWQ